MGNGFVWLQPLGTAGNVLVVSAWREGKPQKNLEQDLLRFLLCAPQMRWNLGPGWKRSGSDACAGFLNPLSKLEKRNNFNYIISVKILLLHYLYFWDCTKRQTGKENIISGWKSWFVYFWNPQISYLIFSPTLHVILHFARTVSLAVILSFPQIRSGTTHRCLTFILGNSCFSWCNFRGAGCVPVCQWDGWDAQILKSSNPQHHQAQPPSAQGPVQALLLSWNSNTTFFPLKLMLKSQRDFWSENAIFMPLMSFMVPSNRGAH